MPRLQALGKLALAPPLLARPKPLLLLTYLAMEGPGSREQLSELFFADAADPRDSLSTTLRRLRRIPSAVRVTAEQIECRLPCDASETLALLQDGKAELACSLYDGQFLEGLNLPLTVELEEWVFATREFLAERMIAANLSLGETLFSLGAHGKARDYADAAYRIAQSGLPTSATLSRLYHLMQRSGHLAAELALTLGRNLRIQTELLPVPNLAPSARLGVPPSGPLIGRTEELDAAITAISAPDTRLLTIHGPGGVGKTRLAQEVMRSIPVDLHFGSARTFVPLDGTTTPESVATAIMHAMGMHAPAGREPWQALADQIGTRSHLLVLDTWEHLTDQTAHISGLLAACAELKIIVTSRARLNLTFEWVHTLTGLALPDADTGSDAEQSDSFHLFVQQARRHNLQFTLTDPAAAARICRAVDGLPLGLTLAAAWTRVMSLRELAQSLEQDVTALDSPDDADHRHSSLRRVLDVSWLRLGTQERKALMRLSVCAGGFTREAASDIAGADMKLLMRLIDRSWLTATPSGRFMQHAVIRQYAHARLKQNQVEAQEAIAAHGRHYLALLTGGEDGAGAGPLLMNRLAREEANIIACLESAVELRDADTIAILCEPLQWYFTKLGRFQPGRAFFERIVSRLASAGSAVDEANSNAHSALSWFCRYTGNADQAIATGRQAVELAQSASDQTRIRAFDALGQAFVITARHEEAIAVLETGITLARSAGAHTRLVRILEHAVHAQSALGQYAQARSKVAEAMALISQGLAPRQIDAVAAHIASGMLDLALQDWQPAEETMIRARQLAQEIDYSGPEALIDSCIVTARMGAAIDAGNARAVEQARQSATTVLALATERSEVVARIFSHGILARAALFKGQLRVAEEEIREGLLVARSLGAHAPGMWMLPWLVELQIARRDGTTAAQLTMAITSDPRTPAWVRACCSGHLAAAGFEPAGSPASLGELLDTFIGGQRARIV